MDNIRNPIRTVGAWKKCDKYLSQSSKNLAMGDAPIEQSNAYPKHFEINDDIDPFAELEVIYPILLSSLVFLFLLTDVGIFSENGCWKLISSF